MLRNLGGSLNNDSSWSVYDRLAGIWVARFNVHHQFSRLIRRFDVRAQLVS